MIGTSIDTWNTVEGAYYTGYGGGEMIWLIVSIVLCVAALISGARHELSSYAKAEQKK